MMISLLFSLFAYGVFGQNATVGCNYFIASGAENAGPAGPGDCYYMYENDAGTEESKMGTCNDDGSLTVTTYDDTKCEGTETGTTDYAAGNFIGSCDGDSDCSNDESIRQECDEEEVTISFSSEACVEFVEGYYWATFQCSVRGVTFGGIFTDDMCEDERTTTTMEPMSTTSFTTSTTETPECEISCVGDGASELMKVYILAFAVVVSLFY